MQIYSNNAMIGLKGVYSFQGGMAKDCEPAKKAPTSYHGRG